MENSVQVKDCAEKYIVCTFLSERKRNHSRKCEDNCFSVGFINGFCKNEEEASFVLNELIKEGKIEIVVKKNKVLFFPLNLS